MQSPKANIATTSKQHHEQPSEAIDITSDEENDVIVLDKINPKPSCSKNVKCATNTTPIKVNINFKCRICYSTNQLINLNVLYFLLKFILFYHCAFLNLICKKSK